MMVSKLFGDGRTASVELPDSIANENGEPVEIEIEWDGDPPPDDWEYATEFQIWLNTQLGRRVPEGGGSIRVTDQGFTQEDAWRLAAGHIYTSSDPKESREIIEKYRAVPLDGYRSHSRIMAIAEMLVSITYDAIPEGDGLTVDERVDQVMGICRHLVSGFKNPTLATDEIDDIDLPDWMDGDSP